MSEPIEDELHDARAALERRFMDRSIAAMTDQRLRTMAERYRDGSITAADMVTELNFSPDAVRGLDRVGSKLMAMSSTERDALFAKVDGTIREIAVRERRAAERRRIAESRSGDVEASNEDRGSFLAQRYRRRHL